MIGIGEPTRLGSGARSATAVAAHPPPVPTDMPPKLYPERAPRRQHRA
jgi:hypothetical protein